MGSSRPSRENKRIALGPFRAPGSGFMAPKGAKAHNTKMSQVVTLCGTVLNANKPILDYGNTLRGRKRAEKAQFDIFWPFFGTGWPYMSWNVACSSWRSIAPLWTPHMAILREKNLGPKFGGPISVVVAKGNLFWPWMPPKRPKMMPEGMIMIVLTERDQVV